MNLIILTVALTFSEPTPYQRAYANAVADGLPLVVSVGCERRNINGAWCCRVDHLDGYTAPCIVVGRPVNGTIVLDKLLPATATAITEPDALDEVNAKRLALGLRPLIRDDALTAGAKACAAARAAGRIAGHTSNDFAYLPSGASATAAGCAALDPSWGWQSCCWDGPQWTTAGAAVVVGADGLRYMHIFCR